LFEAFFEVVEITLKVTLHRKLLNEIAFCQLSSISECDSTIQVSSTSKVMM